MYAGSGRRTKSVNCHESYGFGNGIFEIQISGVRGTTLEAKLFNTQGQHIADFLLNVSDGNVKQTIELSQKIAAGTYYLGIYDGSQSGLVQFIKE